MQRYIQSELNVRDVIFTSDETAAGIRYRAVADWAVLGRKLRKDLARVKNALPSVPSDDIRAYIDSGKITVDGIELVAGDLTVQRYIELPEQADVKYATQTDNDVVVRLDIQVHPELQGEWLAREFSSRVQKMRKKAGLLATDDVLVFYAFDGEGAELLEALQTQAEMIQRTTRSSPIDAAQRGPSTVLLLEEEHELADVKFVLSLARS